ncbi:hypothetical protein OGAPHI_007114 [Ogataea philodendri]|uniref:Uncharacterized protein n=1 Tax=Ogataea philodendri TaxID=1378263 RepID=A0A9P8SZA6_9ASCO|nr:uncharacterized protein OGAPHI_007114 [Ogataea philodendri]KAH3660528.1 hypothetical protein OGAPHI_007114 [Ogataea philodendri]
MIRNQRRLLVDPLLGSLDPVLRQTVQLQTVQSASDTVEKHVCPINNLFKRLNLDLEIVLWLPEQLELWRNQIQHLHLGILHPHCKVLETEVVDLVTVEIVHTGGSLYLHSTTPERKLQILSKGVLPGIVAQWKHSSRVLTYLAKTPCHDHVFASL